MSDQWRENVYCATPLQRKVLTACKGGCNTRVDASDGLCRQCRIDAQILPTVPLVDSEEQEVMPV